jgi:hypothetical protein
MVRTVISGIGATIVGAAFVAALGLGGLTDAGAAPAQPQGTQLAVAAQPEVQRGERRGPLITMALIRTTAMLSNLTVEQVRDSLSQGQSLAQIAAANGSRGDAVVQDVLSRAERQLNQAVANGRISQEQADERLAQFEQRATEIVNDTTLGERIDERVERVTDRVVTATLIPVAADLTGLAPGEIRQRLRGGESLTAIVESAGVSSDELMNAAVDRYRTAVEEVLQ